MSDVYALLASDFHGSDEMCSACRVHASCHSLGGRVEDQPEELEIGDLMWSLEPSSRPA